ncbi:MAG: hypothetical protein Tsb0010_02350 [Parvularculaceae bacterium]
MRHLLSAGLWAALTLAFVGPAAADSIEIGDEVSIVAEDSGRVFAMGGEVDVTGTVRGGGWIMGGDVTVDAAFGKSVRVMGGDVTVGGTYGRNLRIAGGDVTIRADVAGDLSAAGGDVLIDAEGRIGGDAELAGGYVELAAPVTGDLQAAAGDFVLLSDIGGDAEIRAENLQIAGGVRIGGRLHFKGPREPEIPDDVVIEGGFEYEYAEEFDFDDTEFNFEFDEFPLLGLGLGIGALLLICAFSVLIVFISGLILAMLFPSLYGRAIKSGRNDPLISLAIGIGAMVLWPSVAVALMATLLGFWVGVVLLAAWFLTLALTSTTAGYVLGHLILDRNRDAVEPNAMYLLLGAVLLALATFIPFIGWLISGIVGVIALGATTRALFEQIRAGDG